MLKGRLVTLRAIEPADLPNYVRWFNDPEVLAYFGAYRPLNLEQEREWYEQQSRDRSALNFAAEYQGQHVGGGGFRFINPQARNAEVGLLVGEKSLWNQGLGQDILTTLVRYGFDHLNLHRVYLRVLAEHERAVHAYERVGFVHEGRWRQAEWRHGRWQDLLWMSILQPEWSAPAT